MKVDLITFSFIVGLLAASMRLAAPILLAAVVSLLVWWGQPVEPPRGMYSCRLDDKGRLVGVISLSDIARHDRVFAAETMRQVSSREILTA